MNNRDSDKKQEKYVEVSTGVPVYISGTVLKFALANHLVMSESKWIEWRTKETSTESLKRITNAQTLKKLHQKHQSNKKTVPHSSHPNTPPKTRRTKWQPATTQQQKKMTTTNVEKTIPQQTVDQHQKNPTSYKTLLETLLHAEMIDPNVYGYLTPVDPVKVVEPTEYSSYLNTTDLKDNGILDLLNEQEPLGSTIDVAAPAEVIANPASFAGYDNSDLMWFGSPQPNASDDEFSCSREMADEIKSLYN